MSKITLEQWRVLQTVVDAGGFTQAAEVLHKSQSSISYSVTKLQQQLGFSILEMEGRKAKLTDRGLILLEHSRALLQQSDQLESLAQVLSQSWGDELYVLSGSSVPYSLLIDAIAEFKLASPGTKLIFGEESASISPMLLNKSSPIIKLTTAPENNLSTPVMMLEMVAVVSKTHKLALNDNQIHLSDLAGVQQIDTSSGKASDAAFQVTNIPAAIAMVESGMGYAFLPLCEVKQELASGNLVSLNLSDDVLLPCPVYAHLENIDESNLSAELFVNILKS